MTDGLVSLIEDFLEKARNSGQKPLLAVLGPTASGKTALSLRLAQRFSGEIISADSRQIYKYMDIGTDKVSPVQRQRVPHHLIDVFNPDARFTLADYKRMAEQAIHDIIQRGNVPILVGGTGLYISAITQNYHIPETDDTREFRKELERIADLHGSFVLYEKLQEIDPRAATKIHPENLRYIIRALEINYFTGGNKEDQKGAPQYAIFKIGIEWERQRLYRRIDERVEKQFERGLVDEVKRLLEKGYKPEMPAMTSLGYREVLDYLNGDYSIETAKEKIKNATHGYARRQESWWRREHDIFWIPGETLESE